jgi:hypothetical protein
MNKLSETILEIAIIFAKNFSDALLQTASELAKRLEANSQASIIESTSPAKRPPEIENPEFASLAIGDTVTISVNSRNILKFYCGKITAINGDKITVLNTVMEKSWEVAPDEIKYKHL